MLDVSTGGNRGLLRARSPQDLFYLRIKELLFYEFSVDEDKSPVDAVCNLKGAYFEIHHHLAHAQPRHHHQLIFLDRRLWPVATISVIKTLGLALVGVR